MPDTRVVRRRPPRGAAPDGTVVYALEDIASPPGEEACATVAVTTDGTLASLDEAIAGTPEDRTRLLADVLDALRAEGCIRVRMPGVREASL